MLIRIYFNCGEHLEFDDFSSSSVDQERFNDYKEIKIIKEYMYLVGTNSQEWLTALMVGNSQWYPKTINKTKKKKINISVNLTQNIPPDASGTIMSNIISAIYVMDSEGKLYFYFITDNAEPRGINPEHYKNKGKVIDLSDEFLQWYRKGLEELQ